MRHAKDTCKLGRTTSHRRCLFANMLKSLIENEQITTTLPKAKELRRYADRMVTLAKQNTLAAKRRVAADLMLSYNSLTEQQKRSAKKNQDTSAYNTDRQIINKLFGELGTRFSNRQGGYTRIVKGAHRIGDNAQTCTIEYLQD